MKTKVVTVLFVIIATTLFVAASAFALSAGRENVEKAHIIKEGSRDYIVSYPETSLRASYTQPVTRHVPADYSTIQEAINAAQFGDMVLVAAGTYTENISIKSGVIVQGTGGSLSTPVNPLDDSIINGAETGRTVTFSGSSATIAGFTITNGRGAVRGGNIACEGEANTIKDNLIINGSTTSYGGYGGGVYLGSDADYSKVVNNVIQDNWAWATGGGIETRADGTVISGNVIYNNQSDWAGGIYVSGSFTVIRQNIIDNNWADFRDGGGIYVVSSATHTVIENNTVVSNTAGQYGVGGAMYVYEVNEIAIRNNIVANNKDSLSGTGGIHFVSCPETLTLTYNDVYNNQGSDYSGCSPGEGSISADPLFVNAAYQDYHLQSGSPAIDAGDPDPAFHDPEDPASPGHALYPAMGTVRNDMGAYGGRGGVASLVPLDSVTVLGPTKGKIFEIYGFNATVTPSDASFPIRYTWDPVPLSGQGTPQVNYQWSAVGEQHITVRAINDAGGVTGVHTIAILAPPTKLNIDGPTEGIPFVTYAFVVRVTPITATRPIVYVWQASDHNPITHTGDLSDEITLDWTADGDKSIIVQAINDVGSVAGTHVISIVAPYKIYLAIIFNDFPETN